MNEQPLIDQLGNALPSPPFSAEFLAAHARLSDEELYHAKGECKTCGSINPLAFEKRPFTPKIDAVTRCAACGANRAHRIIELEGEVVQEKIDIQAPPTQVTTKHLQCTVCHSETAISLTSDKAALKYVPHHCSVCFPGSPVDLTLHAILNS
jgi:hypothetical protein